jgi:translation initiation factor RLI1
MALGLRDEDDVFVVDNPYVYMDHHVPMAVTNAVSPLTGKTFPIQ